MIATKKWPVSFQKQGKSHMPPKFLIGIFECPECETKFRSRAESVSKTNEVPRLEDLVEKVKRIQSGLIQTKKILHDKIIKLETECGPLMLELGNLQRNAESRAENLESEIWKLREEIKSLKDLLGSNEEVTS